MKTYQKILIGIAAMLILPFIIALFLSKDYNSSSSIQINKSQQEVYDYLKFIKNQDNFGVWHQQDKDMTTQDSGTDGNVGFKYSWMNKEMGNGYQRILKLEEPNLIESEFYFGFGNPALGYFHLKPINNQTTEVTWGIKGKLNYPTNLMTPFMNMDKDFQTGLVKLKSILENNP